MTTREPSRCFFLRINPTGTNLHSEYCVYTLLEYVHGTVLKMLSFNFRTVLLLLVVPDE